MIQCRKYKNTSDAPAEYNEQTQHALRDRFGEHRRAIQNYATDAVTQHFNQEGQKLIICLTVTVLLYFNDFC